MPLMVNLAFTIISVVKYYTCQKHDTTKWSKQYVAMKSLAKHITTKPLSKILKAKIIRRKNIEKVVLKVIAR
jgi:hypothetical protein